MGNINLSPLLSTPPDFQGFGRNFDLIDKATQKIAAPTFNSCCFKKISTYLYLQSKKNIKSDEEFFKKFHLLDKISEINFSNLSSLLETLSSWEKFLENWDPIYKNNKNLQDAKSSIISFKMRLQNPQEKTQAILIPNNNERILRETPFGVEYQQEKEIAQTSLGSWITTSSSLESASKYEYDPLKEGHEDLVGVMDPSALSPQNTITNEIQHIKNNINKLRKYVENPNQVIELDPTSNIYAQITNNQLENFMKDKKERLKTLSQVSKNEIIKFLNEEVIPNLYPQKTQITSRYSNDTPKSLTILSTEKTSLEVYANYFQSTIAKINNLLITWPQNLSSSLKL